MITEVLSAILFAAAIYKLIHRPKGFPPGPRGIPLLGYGPLFSTWDEKLPHKLLKKIGDVYGPVAGIYVSPDLVMISVTSNEAIKEALMNDDLIGRPALAGLEARTFNERLGLMFVDGPLWQEQRRFSLRHLRDLGFGKTSIQDQMIDEIQDLLNDIKKSCEASPGDSIVDFKGIFQVSVVNILWAIVGGKRYQRDDPEFKKILTATDQFFRSGNILGPTLPIPDALVRLLPALLPFTGIRPAFMKPMRDFIMKTIDEHVKTHSFEDDPRDFIDVYLKELEIQKKTDSETTTFTYKQLVAAIIDIFGAGAESTSNSIGFALIHLIHNPEVQSKMQQELDQVCGDSLPVLTDRPRLPYTEAVLMEAQRCSSIAPVTVPHSAVKDTTLQGYFIPKGSLIMLNLDAAMNDEAHWKDPEVFRPERHLNEDGTKIVKSDHFYPFGLGRRMCAGESLAKNTYFLFVTALLKTFSFKRVPNEPLPSLDPVLGFTLGYKGFKAVVETRTPSAD